MTPYRHRAGFSRGRRRAAVRGIEHYCDDRAARDVRAASAAGAMPSFPVSRPDSAATPLRVIIADDDPVARGVIKDALRGAGMIVVAEASNGREAVELVRHYRPDVVLMDIVLPGIGGLAATRTLAEQAPRVAVVVLSDTDDEDTALSALRCGAVGFLDKNVDLGSLPRALEGIRNGEAVISRRLTRLLIEHVRCTLTDGAGMRPVKSVLSEREWEVLDVLCSGGSTEDVAATLVLSLETVRSHIKSILRKLRVSTRAEAIAAAYDLRRTATDIELPAGPAAHAA